MRRARAVLGVVSALLVIVGVLAALDVWRGPSAREVLDTARAFVRANRSVRFTGTLVVRAGDTTGTARLEGEIAGRHRSRLTMAWDDGRVNESVEADGSSNPRNTRTDVGALLDAARNPRRVSSRGATTTIEADVDVADLLGQVTGTRLETITLRATVHDTGRVHSIVLRSRDEQGTLTATLRYSDWGDPSIKIAAPEGDQVANDAIELATTQLAAWDDAPLVMPKTLPAGWALSEARILPAADTKEGCAQVELDYRNGDDPDAGYLVLYEFPNACAEPLAGPGVAPFVAGPYRGFGKSSREEGTLAQITVGATTVQADTDLTLSQLADVLADMAPLDVSPP